MTYTDEFAARDERRVLLDERIDREYRFREPNDEDMARWRREAEELYPQLKGAAEKASELRRFLLENEVQELEQLRIASQQELERLDNPAWSYEESLEGFAKRFIEFIEKEETK